MAAENPAPKADDVPLQVKITNYLKHVCKYPTENFPQDLSDSFPPNNPPLIYQRLFSGLCRSVEPRNIDRIITNIYEMNPQRLADEYGVSEEKEWWFFTLRGRRYKNAKAIKLAPVVGDGYWKLVSEGKLGQYTGLPGLCQHKYFQFYKGKYPNGDETSWFMKEYKISFTEVKVGDWVMCKIYIQQGEGTCECNP